MLGFWFAKSLSVPIAKARLLGTSLTKVDAGPTNHNYDAHFVDAEVKYHTFQTAPPRLKINFKIKIITINFFDAESSSPLL